MVNREAGGGGGTPLPIITIDPGHGGRQPGAVGPTGLLEKDVCLTVALRVRSLLQGQFDVRLTRETDIDVPLARRRAIAGSRAYISIHCNAFGDAAANGTETFWRSGGTANDQRLAQVVQAEMLRALGRRDRGVKTAAFQVLRQGAIPAVLAELAFISNPAEEGILRDPRTHERVAQAIAAAIRAFVQ